MGAEFTSQVQVVRVDRYDTAAIEQALLQALEPLGGMGTYVSPGDSVLLKPNLLTARDPDLAVTTHPEVVAAVGRLVQRAGGKVKVGDSPSSVVTDLENLWDVTGMRAVCEREGFELLSFEKSGSRPVAVDTRVYYVARPVLEADLVINLPKLKTHVLTQLSGAVKNMYGVIPGFRKGIYHKEAPQPRQFAQIVVDVFATVQPSLTIMDAIVAMEGDGPSSGNPIHMGRLLVSSDAVAVDAVAADLIGLNAKRVYTTCLAAEAGLGIGYREAIQVGGDSGHGAGQASLPVTDFVLPSSSFIGLIPTLVVDLISPFIWMKPRVDTTECTDCGQCVDACPTSALSAGGNGGTPHFNDRLCITCWCCHEVCPSDAIRIEKSWLARQVSSRR